jgi:hypothetical protein
LGARAFGLRHFRFALPLLRAFMRERVISSRLPFGIAPLLPLGHFT